MKCRDFREIVDSYLSDELLTETNHGVLQHLEECGNCRAEIDNRRMIRQRLKAAVIGSSEMRMSPQFAKELNNIVQEPRKTRSWFDIFATNRPIISLAAVLLTVFTIGYFAFFRSTSLVENVATINPGSEIAVASLVDAAVSDHDHCAVRHDLEDAPKSLMETSLEYIGLENVILDSLDAEANDFRLIAAHSCKFAGQRFAHVVLRQSDTVLSFLLADESGVGEINDEIVSLASNRGYRVSRFFVDKRAAFVVSDLDESGNDAVAHALRKPLRRHFGESGRIQAALLANY